MSKAEDATKPAEEVAKSCNLNIPDEEYQMHAFGTTANEMLFRLKKLFSDIIEHNLEQMTYQLGSRVFKDGHNNKRLHEKFMDAYDEHIKDVEDVTRSLFHVDDRIIYDEHCQEDLELTEEDVAKEEKEIMELKRLYTENKQTIAELQQEEEILNNLKIVQEKLKPMMKIFEEVAENTPKVPLLLKNYEYYF